MAVQSQEALDEVKELMGGVVERFRPVLKERFQRHPEQVGITSRFLTSLGGAPVCLLAFFYRPEYPGRDGACLLYTSSYFPGRKPGGDYHPGLWPGHS